jgi:hypothetical protein
MAAQAFCNACKNVVEREFVNTAVEIHDGLADRLAQGHVTNNRGGYDGQGAATVAKRRDQSLRLQIHHPVAKRRFRARAAIVQFVGVNDDDASRRAVAALATILEGLDAAKRHAKRIGVVAMRLEDLAVQPGLDALYAVHRCRDADAIARRSAQSFKIDRCVLG